MKVHFEPKLDYQLQAIEAACSLFRGREICCTEFTVTKSAVGGALLPYRESDLGIGNRLILFDDELLKNLGNTQLHNDMVLLRRARLRPPYHGDGDVADEMAANRANLHCNGN
ncbi:MAG: hypothetical protein LAP85_15380 [Acidobacteriia bacterium]|nr:hypothetical protein [Terriglobia bacterium]